MTIERFPVFREDLSLTTWASGTGGRWAERRTSVVGERGGSIEVAALWVHVDIATGRPKRLAPSFFDVYGEAAGGRTVHARLAHGGPPDGGATPRRGRCGSATSTCSATSTTPCTGRSSRSASTCRRPSTVTVEYRGGIDRGQRAELVVDGHELWLLADGAVAASGRIDDPGDIVSSPVRRGLRPTPFV